MTVGKGFDVLRVKQINFIPQTRDAGTWESRQRGA